MRMKKVGLLGLALVLALAITGAGFAKWNQTLRIDGTVTTGDLCVGIRDAGTSDPADTNDHGFDLASAVPVPLGKDVGKAESVQVGDVKCWHGGVAYYETIKFTVENAYPFYYWRDSIDIANCGSTPAKIDSIEVGIAGVWTPIWEASTYDIWSGPLGDCIWLGAWSLNFPSGGGEKSGTWISELGTELVTNNYNTQLDPCDVAKITLGFFVFQGQDPHEDGKDLNPPQNASSDMYLRVNFCNWNEP